MADLITFEKQRGKFYVVLKNTTVKSATVTLSAAWTPSEGAPVDKVQVTGANDRTKTMFLTGQSGVNIISFNVKKEKANRYEVQFDKPVDAEVLSSDNKKLILNQPKTSLSDAKNGTFISRENGNYGLKIPDGLENGSQVVLRMERDDDSKSDGRALTAVEIPIGNDNNRMSFSDNTSYETEEENVDLDPGKTDDKRFFKFDFEGLNQDVNFNSSGGGTFGDDGNRMPEKPLLEFRDETGSFNAFMYIKEKNLVVNTADVEGARIILAYTDVVLEGTTDKCDKEIDLEITCPLADFENCDFEIVAEARGINNSNVTFNWYRGYAPTPGVGTLILSGKGENKLTGTTPAAGTSQHYDCQITYKEKGCDITRTKGCNVQSKDNPVTPNPLCDKEFSIQVQPTAGWAIGGSISSSQAEAGSAPIEVNAQAISDDGISTDGVTWTFIEDDGTILSGPSGTNTVSLPYPNKCGRKRKWLIEAEYDNTGTSPPGYCDFCEYHEVETVSNPCPTSDPVPDPPTECGTKPPIITQVSGDWGVQITSNVISPSTVSLHFEKRDRPDRYNTAISKISIVGSDSAKETLRLDRGQERDETSGTFSVASVYSTFYRFAEMDNIRDPIYDDSKKRLEFLDEDGSDANAWVEIKDHVVKCDRVGVIIGPDECLPGPWNVGGETYDPNHYEEPIAPAIDSSSGGLQCSKSGEKDVILDLSNYRNKLVTLELTYTIAAAWTQHFEFNIPNCSDLYIDNSRHGGNGNEYAVPAFTQSTNTAENQTFKFYNLDGGHTYRFNHNHDVGPEPIRDIFKQECVEEEVETPLTDSEAVIRHVFDDNANINIGNTPSSDDDQVSVQAMNLSDSGGGSTASNKHYEITFSGLAAPITADNFNKISIGGVSDETASNPPDGAAPGGGGAGFTSGISFGKKVEFVSQNKIKVWFTNGSNNSFVRRFRVKYPGGSSATQINTVCSCVVDGTESWTETGLTWPRFQGGVYVTKTGGNSVSWIYEDGGGTTGGRPDDVYVTVTVKKVRDTLPAGTITMGDLEDYVWLPSSTADASYNYGPVDGGSLADWYDHSDKIRIRNPSEKRSLTDLRLDGVDFSEFIRAAAAPYEAF